MLLRLILKPRIQTNRLRYCTKIDNENKGYSGTIFLPKTKFPLRLESKKLVERDKKITDVAEFDQLYKWQRSHLSEPEFVLHDGPPYANGKPHMGHALNKILKDTILRCHILKSHKVHYVPGWDCHGLPIELKALSDADATPLEIRRKARSFAKTAIEQQKTVFESWGLAADWNKYYATYNADYMKLQLKLFHKLFRKNLIYRDFKPVYWSPSSQTALAEAELEYNDKHKTLSAFVRLKVQRMLDKQCDGIYALIWTTTPWTLPANQAVCYNPNLSYSIVKSTKDASSYIVATQLIDSLSTVLNSRLDHVEDVPCDVLSQCTYAHPIFKEKHLTFVPAAHVTVEKGTGLVHAAPAHGPEDFLVALNRRMQIDDLVNSDGCYNSNSGAELEGKFVLDEGTSKVLQMIKDDVVSLSEHVHSYPYDWRTKKPVIVRASRQWFFDTNSVKNRAINLLEDVEFIPRANGKLYKRNLINEIQRRPYWCISRQRKWGVPIPVFFHKTNGDIIVNEDLIRHYCMLIDNRGTDFWWASSPEELIPKELRSDISLENVEKGQDILDIWFDSGISWAHALEGDKIADMCLEGVDQIGGWFHSSLMTSVALRDKAPYKAMYVHGFVVDEQGTKMAKSLGNVVDPSEVVGGSKKTKPYGVDCLRWWVACHANQDAMAHISPNVLQACADELQKIRSVLRFALGCLHDYQRCVVDYKNLSLLDKHMLHLLHSFHEQVEVATDDYQFQRVCGSVLNFLTNQVSALYYTAIKDRLYCDPISDISRRCSQFVLLQIFEVVTQAIAPIVPHLVEEMYTCLPQKTGKNYFCSVHAKPEDCWHNAVVDKVASVILSVKKEINVAVGANTADVVVTLRFSPSFHKLLQETTTDFIAELADIFQVSRVVVNESVTQNDCELAGLTKTELFLCERCRRLKSQHANELCTRCCQAVKLINTKTAAAN